VVPELGKNLFGTSVTFFVKILTACYMSIAELWYHL
jgi:hypothetical protein